LAQRLQTEKDNNGYQNIFEDKVLDDVIIGRKFYFDVSEKLEMILLANPHLPLHNSREKYFLHPNGIAIRIGLDNQLKKRIKNM